MDCIDEIVATFELLATLEISTPASTQLGWLFNAAQAADNAIYAYNNITKEKHPYYLSILE